MINERGRMGIYVGILDVALILAIAAKCGMIRKSYVSEGFMGKLSTKSRNKLSASEFGMPGSRKYPMPDRSHAANAKARASQQVAKGNLSKSAEKRIDAKANKVLSRGRGK